MTDHNEPDTFREILAVAARLFADQGYHATSMREVGRQVGLNPSSIYHHFSGKEQILFTVMDRAMDDALEVLEDIVAAEHPPVEKARRVLDFYTRYFAGDRDRLLLLVNEIRSLSPSLRQVLEGKERRYVGLIRRVLEELAAAGLLREVNPVVAAFSFFGMVHYTMHWYRPDGPIGLENLAESISDIFLQGVLEP